MFDHSAENNFQKFHSKFKKKKKKKQQQKNKTDEFSIEKNSGMKNLIMLNTLKSRIFTEFYVIKTLEDSGSVDSTFIFNVGALTMVMMMVTMVMMMMVMMMMMMMMMMVVVVVVMVMVMVMMMMVMMMMMMVVVVM